jgi:hypothetical protein
MASPGTLRSSSKGSLQDQTERVPRIQICNGRTILIWIGAIGQRTKVIDTVYLAAGMPLFIMMMMTLEKSGAHAMILPKRNEKSAR